MKILITFLNLFESLPFNIPSNQLFKIEGLDFVSLNLLSSGFNSNDLRQIIFITLPFALCLYTYFYFQNKKLKTCRNDNLSTQENSERFYDENDYQSQINRLKLDQKKSEKQFDNYINLEFSGASNQVAEAFKKFANTLIFNAKPEKYLLGKAESLQQNLTFINTTLNRTGKDIFIEYELPNKFSPFYQGTPIKELDESIPDHMPFAWVNCFVKELIKNLNSANPDCRISFQFKEEKGEITLIISNTDIGITDSVISKTLGHPSLFVGEINKNVTLIKKPINNTIYQLIIKS